MAAVHESDKAKNRSEQGSSSSGNGKKKNSDEFELYTTKSHDTLGSISKKFGLPSWKYLYEYNKNLIGENPDLLKTGTEIMIPKWNATTGDELIKEKGGDPFAYTGGLQYRYPWVPLSMTLTNIHGETLKEQDENGQESTKFKEGKEYVIIDADSGKELLRGTLRSADEFEQLIPDAKNWYIKIDGVIYR
jgi:hypothetical protein